jgi:hypothetical protein
VTQTIDHAVWVPAFAGTTLRDWRSVIARSGGLPVDLRHLTERHPSSTSQLLHRSIASFFAARLLQKTMPTQC